MRRSTGCKDAFDQLLFYCLALRRSQYFRHQCSTGSSFRAFRFTRKGYAASVSGKAANGCAAATRCPGGRRGRCLYRQLPRRTASGSEKRSSSDHPDDLRTIRHGTAVGEIAEEYSVPEGRAKSALAPIRRPPSRGGPLHRSAPTLFSLNRARPVSLLARQKRNGGVHLPSHHHG